MRRMLSVSLLSVALATSIGCARKKPVTADAPPTATTPSTPSAPAPPDPAPAASDPLAGDLDAVNAYVRSQGLLRDVYYDYDSAELSQEARQTLASNARFLNEHPYFEVAVEGHCDERGTSEYNLALGERRAGSAKEYMAGLGVAKDRVRSIAYGEERPVCATSEEACWSQNRRAHLILVGRRAAG